MSVLCMPQTVFYILYVNGNVIKVVLVVKRYDNVRKAKIRLCFRLPYPNLTPIKPKVRMRSHLGYLKNSTQRKHQF